MVVGVGEKAAELILGPPLRSFAAGMMQALIAGPSHVLMNSSQVIFLWNSPEHPSTHGAPSPGALHTMTKMCVPRRVLFGNGSCVMQAGRASLAVKGQIMYFEPLLHAHDWDLTWVFPRVKLLLSVTIPLTCLSHRFNPGFLPM